MKINYKMYRSVGTEPFKVQEIDGRLLEFHYLNDTAYLAENVTKGRFYVWASDGTNFKLFVERGFYDKVDYFFDKEINAIWLNFLVEASKVRSKTTPISLASSFIPLGLAVFGFLKFPDQGTMILIGGFVISLGINMFFSSKLNRKVRELNHQAHLGIQNALTEEGFEKFFEDQREYGEVFYRETYGLEDEEVLLVENDNEEVSLEEDAEVVESKDIDYNKMTVAELKEMAKELNLEGYSALKKADLIELIKNRGEMNE